jgi:hypothetical protein
MRTILLLGLLAASVVAHADQCDDHLAFASSGTVTVSTIPGSSAQNGAVAYAIFNPFVCVSKGIAYAIRTVDSSVTNYYGFAIVGVNGNTVPGTVYASTGPITGAAFTSAGVGNAGSLWWAGGPVTLPVGMYMVVLGTTCSSSCAQLFGDASFGHFYSFVFADTSANSPWTFDSSGFSGFSAANVPQVSLTLSTTATQTISGNLATVTTNSAYFAHIYVGGVVSVQGVTTPTATAMNCSGCLVKAINNTTGAITYRLPSSAASFSGTVNAGTILAVSPVMVQQARFVAPTALIF